MGDLVTDSHSILVIWRKNFSQLLHVRRFSEVRQTKIHTASPPVPERHKSPGTDQIPAEMIKAWGRTTRSKILTLVNSIWNKEECERS